MAKFRTWENDVIECCILEFRLSKNDNQFQSTKNKLKTTLRKIFECGETIKNTSVCIQQRPIKTGLIDGGWFQNEPPCDDVLHILTISEIQRKWSFFEKVLKILKNFSNKNKSKINYLNIRTSSKTSGRILNRKRYFFKQNNFQ